MEENNAIVVWKEVSREYVKAITNSGIQILIYNPLSNCYSIESAGKKCIANSKYAYECLKYYILIER